MVEVVAGAGAGGEAKAVRLGWALDENWARWTIAGWWERWMQARRRARRMGTGR